MCRASLAGRSLLLLFALILVPDCVAWTSSSGPFRSSKPRHSLPGCKASEYGTDGDMLGETAVSSISTRRSLLKSWAVGPAIAGAHALLSSPLPSVAAPEATSSAEVTDRIFITVKGLPGSASSVEPKRIVIGLFGKNEPSAVQQLKRLVTREGLPAPCRPRAERTLQKEQLEANMVYNGCLDGEEVGVTLQYSAIWRIIKDERLDMGAVSGRFVAREYPEWKSTSEQPLKHDAPGVVSVRRGNDSGFGFTIYPGDGTKNNELLNEEHIVVGRVIEGMDIVRELNDVPVVNSAKVNYMALTGGPKTSSAPDRSCRYGGPMYCNENKPLVKLTITDTGVL